MVYMLWRILKDGIMSENLLKSAEGQIYTVTSRCRSVIPKGMEGMTTQAEQLTPCLPRSQWKTMLVDDCLLPFVLFFFFWRSLQHTEWCHPCLGWFFLLQEILWFRSISTDPEVCQTKSLVVKTVKLTMNTNIYICLWGPLCNWGFPEFFRYYMWAVQYAI